MTAKIISAKRRTKRLPDFGPWPPVGYIGVEKLMAATDVASPQSIYNYIADGLLPPPQRIGPNRVGWPVEQAREAVAALPRLVNKRPPRPAPPTRRAAESEVLA